MVAEQRALGPVLVVDGGLTLSKPERGRIEGAELEQRRMKAELIARTMSASGLDAVALGFSDWALGTDFVRSLAAEHRLPVLAANLQCGDERPYPGQKVVEISGRKVGLVGVTEGTVDGCVVEPAAPALKRAIAELGPVDVVLGLLPYDSDRTLAEVLGPGDLGLDVVVDARGKYAVAGPDRKGASWAIGAGSRGKSVGVLTLTWTEGARQWGVEGQADRLKKEVETTRARVDAVDARIAKGEADPVAEQRLRAQREAYARQLTQAERQLAALDGAVLNRLTTREIQLAASIPDHPETAALVKEAKRRITKAGGADPDRFVARIAPEGSPFAGGEACVGCHQAEHAQWSTTGHARAWQVLVAEDRAMDDDCWSCHVTGAGSPGGPAKAAEAGGLRDVQCEACHGAARDHVAAPDTVKPVRDPAVSVCATCHDGKQDGGRFDPATYRPKVVHGDGAP